VVHSVLKGTREMKIAGFGRWITFAAYSLGAIAGALHFYSALVFQRQSISCRLTCPNRWLFNFNRCPLSYISRQQGWQRAVGATALAVFAVSAIHLSHHHNGEATSWVRELDRTSGFSGRLCWRSSIRISFCAGGFISEACSFTP